jgi:hypothetical protein
MGVFIEVCLTKFKNNQILLNKISHRFLMTTKLFNESNIPRVFDEAFKDKEKVFFVKKVEISNWNFFG